MNIIHCKNNTDFSSSKNQMYYQLTALDIQKLPLTPERKKWLIAIMRVVPVDRNLLRVITEAIRQLRATRKNFPQEKPSIASYFNRILEDYFSASLSSNEACTMFKQFNLQKGISEKSNNEIDNNAIML